MVFMKKISSPHLSPQKKLKLKSRNQKSDL